MPTKPFLILLNEANRLIFVNRYAAQAISAYKQAEALKDPASLQPFANSQIISLWEGLALSYFYNGDYSNARKLIRDIPETAFTHVVEGHIFYNEYDYGKALQSYQRAVTHCRNTNTDTGVIYAMACRGLASCYFQQALVDNSSASHSLSLASDCFERAISILDALPEDNLYKKLELPMTEHGYARLLAQQQLYEKAEEHYRIAIANAINNCGNENGNYDIAIMKLFYSQFLINHQKRVELGSMMLKQAVDTLNDVIDDKCHPALLTAYTIVAECYNQHRNNTGLKNLMTAAVAFAHDWPLRVTQQSQKDMNSAIANTKIKTILTLQNNQSGLWQRLGFWHEQAKANHLSIAAASVAIVGTIAAANFLHNRRR